MTPFKLALARGDIHFSGYFGQGSGTLEVNQNHKIEASAASASLEYAYYISENFFASLIGTYIVAPIEYKIGSIKSSGTYKAYTSGLGLGLNFSDYLLVIQQEFSIMNKINIKSQSSSLINGNVYRQGILRIYQGGMGSLLRVSFIKQFRFSRKSAFGMFRAGIAMEKLVQPISVEAVQRLTIEGPAINDERYKNEVSYSYSYDIVSLVVGVFI